MVLGPKVRTVWRAYIKQKEEAKTKKRRAGPSKQDILRFWVEAPFDRRQCILSFDEPAIVKKLYKINLSLLCVGFMKQTMKSSDRNKDGERVFDLLEAMEFLDVDTGILTVCYSECSFLLFSVHFHLKPFFFLLPLSFR